MAKTRRNPRRSRKTRKARKGQAGSGFGFGNSLKASMPQFNRSFSMKNQWKKGKNSMKGYMAQTRASMSNAASQMRKGVNFGALKNSIYGRPYNGGIPGASAKMA
jgi:hypothetical protein